MGTKPPLRLKRTSVNIRIEVGSLVKSLVVPNRNLFLDLAASPLLILSLKGRARSWKKRFRIPWNPLTIMESQ